MHKITFDRAEDLLQTFINEHADDAAKAGLRLLAQEPRTAGSCRAIADKLRLISSKGENGWRDDMAAGMLAGAFDRLAMIAHAMPGEGSSIAIDAGHFLDAADAHMA